MTAVFLLAVGALTASCTSAPAGHAVKTTTSVIPARHPSVPPADFTLSPLVLRPGLGLVAQDNQSNGCSELYLTTDFVHWSKVTPSLPPSLRCRYGWESASFVSPTVGWILGRDEGNVDTVLLHTDDGGHSWVDQPGSGVGSNGGSQVIGFASPTQGWRQQFATGSNAPYTLETTSDGGESWSQVPPPVAGGGCQLAPDVFADAQVGFSGTYLPPDSPIGPSPLLWTTTNGGASWRPMTLTAPSSFQAATAVYGLPSFFGGGIGVLPVVWIGAQTAAVAFYQTTNYFDLKKSI